jgi:hypothetical protein
MNRSVYLLTISFFFGWLATAVASQPSPLQANHPARGAFFDSGQLLGNALSHGAALGDLNGNGYLDAVMANVNGLNQIWLNDGSGHFAAGQAFEAANSRHVALAVTTLQLWRPNLQALVAGEGDNVTITAEQVAAVDAFLTDLMAVAGPELQQVITAERARLGPPEKYVGMTMSEARGLIVGYGVRLPFVSRD